VSTIKQTLFYYIKIHGWTGRFRSASLSRGALWEKKKPDPRTEAGPCTLAIALPQSWDRSTPIHRGEESRSPDAILRHFGNGSPIHPCPISVAANSRKAYAATTISVVEFHQGVQRQRPGPPPCPLLGKSRPRIFPQGVWNSMAGAPTEGKLMYHCSLSLRLISWTLVG